MVRANVGAVDLVLGVLPPQPVMVTILASGETAEMYLTFTGCPVSIPWPGWGARSLIWGMLCR